MTITRASAKKKGSLWEKEAAAFFKERGWDTERRAKEGKNDRGDISGIPGVVLECKNTVTMNLAAAMTEAAKEADNDGVGTLYAVLMRRPRKPVAQGYAIMTIDQFEYLLYLKRRLEEEHS